MYMYIVYVLLATFLIAEITFNIVHYTCILYMYY